MPGPGRSLVVAELARLCEGEPLRRSPGHTRLLRYLVERTLDGDEAALSETAIAIAVFRRDPATFDAHRDPIVRVAASRLRIRLAACYASGARPLRIVLPPGGYVPRFAAAAREMAEAYSVQPMRNATGAAGHDRHCRAFARRLAVEMTRAGRPVAQGDGEAPVAAAALLDCVLSRDAGGALRVTVRLVDAQDGHVRWTETEARPEQQHGRAEDAVLARVLARLAAGA